MHERLRVSCLRDVAEAATAFEATHVVSVVDPDLTEAEMPRIERGSHHVFRLFDQERAEATFHFDDVVADIFGQLAPVAADPRTRIVVHCHAGVSRSTAIAYGLLALADEPGCEQEAFDALLRITRKPWPAGSSRRPTKHSGVQARCSPRSMPTGRTTRGGLMPGTGTTRAGACTRK